QGEITFYGGTNPPENLTMKGNICRVENPIPRMDFVVEAGNRLWGCRYGTNRKGETVNEIYASALGSFRVWEKFEGISDDSFMLSCGTDGPFTGAVTYNGQPIFFKEDCMHRVYGTFPFGVTPVACNGVQAGSADSLALVGNQLFYKSPAGICTYSGSQPILLDLPFGGISYHSAMGAGNQTHYYLAMKDSQGIPVLFVYDTVTGLMMKEKGEAFLHLAGFGGQVYATLVTPGGKQLLCLTGQPGLVPTDETKVHWFGISGIIGMRQPGGRYVQNLELVLSLPMGTAFRVWAQYDSDGEWVPLADLTGGKTRHITLPLRVRRCDHLQLKIQGKGEFTLHALIKTLREGGHGRCT
ncbi:MAG: hypothetical protein IKM39_04370, partial [Clostridia bacterium]|nr:hypothetical protein [Clostridia bacterium]